eukprot:TRINITY_DN4089_c0_g1_i1.p1 TRINITY_DN4089_c0_g1~~TRINITY_DN4089_c0_g1_i1.p1  ORF type:complete len:439 (-),score=31.22 TRINITY_DN4089_c0_g1_i1:41-1357(-)
MPKTNGVPFKPPRGMAFKAPEPVCIDDAAPPSCFGLSPSRKVKIVHISDTHNYLRQWVHTIPDGDILVHSGDFTNNGEQEEIQEFLAALDMLPHTYKVIIGGNHELGMDKRKKASLQQMFTSRCRRRQSQVIYLHDSSCVIHGIKLYGTSWNPVIQMAWGVNEETRQKKFRNIDPSVDVLITHTPPAGIMDNPNSNTHAGDQYLRHIVETSQIQAHLFGHVHGQAGFFRHRGKLYSNAAMKETGRAHYFNVYVPKYRSGKRSVYTPMYTIPWEHWGSGHVQIRKAGGLSLDVDIAGCILSLASAHTWLIEKTGFIRSAASPSKALEVSTDWQGSHEIVNLRLNEEKGTMNQRWGCLQKNVLPGKWASVEGGDIKYIVSCSDGRFLGTVNAPSGGFSWALFEEPNDQCEWYFFETGSRSASPQPFLQSGLWDAGAWPLV